MNKDFSHDKFEKIVKSASVEGLAAKIKSELDIQKFLDGLKGEKRDCAFNSYVAVMFLFDDEFNVQFSYLAHKMLSSLLLQIIDQNGEDDGSNS